LGKITGFKEYPRETYGARPIQERVGDWREFVIPLAEDQLKVQGARCMDCGIPFCHEGCPLGNYIPDWNDLVYTGDWKQALDRLHATNNFPEFTGRVCPAPCEASCVLNIHNNPVTIKQIEMSIADRGFDEKWIVPEPPATRTGKSVAVIGSGPAGMACAQQLNRAGHTVTLFERDDRIGGLLMYGIPDFKLEKRAVQRRVDLIEAEGVILRPNTNVGVDVQAEQLIDEFDAVAICVGSTVPRDLDVPGRELDGVHFAMDFLVPQNRRVWRESSSQEEGGERLFAALTKSLEGENGRVSRLNAVKVAWDRAEGGGFTMREVPGSEFAIECELVLLAMGYLHPDTAKWAGKLGVELDGRGNVQVNPDKMTSRPGVFAAGDAARGQSLVVWAIAEGRDCARGIDRYLMGETQLP
jgi:glutamate synthase (NADPH/NADH) small chain